MGRENNTKTFNSIIDDAAAKQNHWDDAPVRKILQERIAQQTSVFLETMGITRYLLQSKPDILFIESMFEFQIWHS